MSWQTLILFQSVLVASSIICLRILARRKATARASFAVNGGMYVFLYLAVLFLIPWLGKFSTSAFSDYWWRYIVGGLAFALTNVFTYKTLTYFDAAVSTISVSGLSALFTIIGADLFLGEGLDLKQLFGGLILMAAIFYGVLATQYSKRRDNPRKLLAGSLFALLAGLTFAIAVVNEKSLLSHMTIASYGVFGIGFQMFIAVLLALLFQPKETKLLTKAESSKWVILSGLFRGVAGVCFMLSEVRSNNVGLVSVISNFRLIIVVLLGWWLLNERQYIWRKLSAALVAMLGLAIMLWS